MTPEGEVVKSCLDYLYVRNIYAWRNSIGQKGKYHYGGPNGSADVFGIMPDGRFLAVECKAGRNGLSECQREFIDKIRRNGGIAVCVRSVDELIAYLQSEGY